MMDLCERTKALWRAYLSEEDPQAVAQVLEWMDPDCVVIGTGRHEYYTSLQKFVEALKEEVAERRQIHLHIVDEWYSQKELGPQACLVYGGLHMNVVQTENIYADMDTRFSLIYQKIGQQWQIVHVHQSMPNLEQKDGEYYPKSLTERIQEVQDLAEHMRLLARQDSLTGLLNHRTFFDEGESYLEKKGPFWFLVLDLDNFKRVNDTMGHLAGDEVLKRIAGALQRSVRSQDLVGRVGGDEFALLCDGPQGEPEISAMAERIMTAVADARGDWPCWPGLSIGIARVRPGEELREAYSRADAALYRVKRRSKNAYSVDPS